MAGHAAAVKCLIINKHTLKLFTCINTQSVEYQYNTHTVHAAVKRTR